MLDVQYRMHPSISRFPSSEFYNFSLHDGTVDSAGNILASLTPPSSSHLPVDAATGNRPSVVFLDHAGSESLRDRSRVNHNEANIVCSVVEDLLLQNEVTLSLYVRFVIDKRSTFLGPAWRRYWYYCTICCPDFFTQSAFQR